MGFSVMEGSGSFDQFRLGNLPTLMYVPDFITETEESQLLNNIYGSPVSKWKSLKNRRLQNWGGVVHEKGLLPQDLPPWLTKITQRIYEKSGLFPLAINHVLINEYLPNQGIMPHQDGPAYFPVVAILSLGSPVVMDFTPHSKLRTSTDTSKNDVDCRSSGGQPFVPETDELIDNHRPFSILLMPRSLLIFKDDAYSGKFSSSIVFVTTCTLEFLNELAQPVHKNLFKFNNVLFAEEKLKSEPNFCVRTVQMRYDVVNRILPTMNTKMMQF
ncbi:hypothetical protein JRO89_XS03G0322600 [Xanthoceras sorbifolium]|uniref:Alpha-ketoglutarate-dependent dioxygenase AlkB-like domain-containing protein n=1 Tax=Xanthoceras sorbifolium TaxID=99658 RepID=A0ABQ8ID92_9ROSI|nr:hypothetical protein JRO89_XS03G0322600 [Xanthoceras sorbifolium]